VTGGHSGLLAQLLDQGADPDLPDREGRLALCCAVERGDLESARALVNAGADLQASGVSGKRAYPPLLWAARNNALALAALLLEAGADPNVQNASGDTALHLAVKNKFPKMVTLLLNAGADPNRADDRGKTPLHWRLKKEYAAVYEPLLAAGADPFRLDAKGSDSPLTNADRGIRDQIRKKHTWDLYRAELAAWDLTEESTPPPEFWSALAQKSPPVAPSLWVDEACFYYEDDKAEREQRIAGILRGLLQAGMSPETRYDSSPPLYTAVRCRSIVLARVLLGAGADVNARAILQETPLMAAREPALARLLLAAGADLTLRRKTLGGDYNALQLAIDEDLPEIVDVLLKAGADVNELQDGRTPLMIAAEKGRLAIARRLLAHGADLEIRSDFGQTALYRAVFKRNTKLVTLLLDAGANPDTPSHDGYTPLLCAVVDKSRAIINRLLEAGADPFPVLKDGRTAYDLAAGQSKIAARLAELMQQRPQPDLTSAQRQPALPALHRAALWGDVDALRALLAEGADADARTHRGDTPLIVAAAWGQRAAAQALLEAGAAVDAENVVGETAWAYAVANGHDALAQLLRQTGARADFGKLLGLIQRRDALETALRRGDLDAARAMVAQGEVDIDGPRLDGHTPLLAAAIRRDDYLLHWLLAAGANPDAAFPDCPPPLLWAAREGQPALVEQLLGLGAALAATDEHGDTALHLAAREAHVGVVESLLLAEAEVNARNRQGETPLCACLAPLLAPDRPIGSTRADARTAIVKALLDFDADPNQPDETGRAPLILAQAAGLNAAAEALRAAGATESAAIPQQRESKATKPVLIPLHAPATGGPLLHTLRLGSSARAVAYSPDGRYLAAAIRSKVTIWETKDWRECCQVKAGSEVHALAWRGDGVQLAVAISPVEAAARLGLARILARGLTQARAKGQIDAAQEAEFQAKMEANWRQTGILVWDTAALAAGGKDIEPEFALGGHPQGVRAVAYSPDGLRLLSGGKDGAVCLWDTESGVLLRVLKERGSKVTGLAWSADGELAVVSGFNGLLEAWEVETGTRRYTCPAGESGGIYNRTGGDVHGLARSPDGRWLATCANNRSVRLWELGDGAAGAVNEDHEYGVVSVAWHPTRQLIASGGTDHTVRVWNGNWLSGSRVLRKHASTVNSVAWHPGGRHLASDSDDNTVRIWDPFRPTPQAAKRPQHRDRVRSLAWSPDGRFVVSGGGYKDQTVKVWDGATGELLQTLTGHDTPIEALAFSPDGTRLACGAKFGYEGGQRITLWDTATWRALGTANYESEYRHNVVALAFSPNGKLVAGGDSDCLIFVWHAESRRMKYLLKGHKQYYAIRIQVAFTHDGETLITGGHQDGKVIFWDAASGEELATLPGKNNADALALSPDGARLLVGTGGKLQVWDVEERAQVKTWKGPSMLEDATWLPDGRHVLTVSYSNKSAEVWEATTGKRVAAFETDAPLYACAVSPDGLGAVVGDSQGRVIFLRLRGE
jgi:ankyrin repeat protein/DNA-binding beta-propeller fold protein YncE